MSLSSYVPETTARELPVLPAEAWPAEAWVEDDDTDTDDDAFENDGVTAAIPRERMAIIAANLPEHIRPDATPLPQLAPPPPAVAPPGPQQPSTTAPPTIPATPRLAPPPTSAPPTASQASPRLAPLVPPAPSHNLPLIASPQPAPSPNLPLAAPPDEAAAPARKNDRDTVAGVRRGRSQRRLPLVPARSDSTPPALPPAPPLPQPRTAEGARLPLAAEPSGPHVVPRPPAARTPGGLQSGRTVAGRYEIVERIGQGGMGKVYKVSHAQLGKVFALKVIGDNIADSDEARELFYREARMASSVNHTNITSVVDFGEDDDLGAFMVMELVEGEPLAKILHRETRIGVRVACEIILQVADALHYIHGKAIVHCDIKTENILVCELATTKRRQLQVKLLDFGLARSLTARSTGPLSGTPHYVSPERIRGDAASPSSDIYALGILFYEIVTGHVPWDGAVANILHGHLELQPTPPSQLVPGGLDPALENLILRALAKQPADRHKDMAAFIYELRTVMDMLGFGRRRRGGPGKRVVIERSKNERDALVNRAFDACRLPLALVSPQGVIQVANAAFARFVMGVQVEVEGLPVQSTPLVNAWTSFEDDLTRAVNGHAVRRMLEIEVPSKPSQRLLMWLDAAEGGYVLVGVQPIDLG